MHVPNVAGLRLEQASKQAINHVIPLAALVFLNSYFFPPVPSHPKNFCQHFGPFSPQSKPSAVIIPSHPIVSLPWPHALTQPPPTLLPFFALVRRSHRRIFSVDRSTTHTLVHILTGSRECCRSDKTITETKLTTTRLPATITCFSYAATTLT